MFGKKQKGDPRIRAILEEEDIQYEIDSDNDFKIVIGLENDRSQVVFVNSNTETFAGVEIREIWSIGLKQNEPLSADMANELLRRNNQYKVGSWSVVQGDDEVLAVFTIVVSADADNSEILQIIFAVAEHADQIESEFLKNDDL